MSLLIVQHIQTQWTKLSRGGLGAQLRSWVPDRFALPYIEQEHSSGMRIIRQEIMALERHQFEPSFEMQSSEHRSGDRVPMRLCEIEIAERTVTVSYHYQDYLGAPRRPAIAKLAFTLGDQQWGLITANGRQTHEWGWSYARHVIHIGLYLKDDLPSDIHMPPPSHDFTHIDEHALF